MFCPCCHRFMLGTEDEGYYCINPRCKEYMKLVVEMDYQYMVYDRY